MNNSNIIVSVIIVLCVAAGVTAYGLTHDTSGVMNSLSGFTPSSSNGNGPGDNNTNMSTITDHNSDGAGNTSGSSNGNLSSNNNSGSSGNNNENGAIINKNTKSYKNTKIHINTTKLSPSTENNTNTIKNNTSSIKKNNTTSDGWISESEAIKIAGGNENLVSINKSGDMYILTYKFYVSEVGQYPETGWYESSIGISKTGKNLGLV